MAFLCRFQIQTDIMWPLWPRLLLFFSPIQILSPGLMPLKISAVSCGMLSFHLVIFFTAFYKWVIYGEPLTSHAHIDWIYREINYIVSSSNDGIPFILLQFNVSLCADPIQKQNISYPWPSVMPHSFVCMKLPEYFAVKMIQDSSVSRLVLRWTIRVRFSLGFFATTVSRPVLGPSCLIQWVPGALPGDKTAGEWRWQHTSI